MVPVCSSVMLGLVLAVHSYHVIAYPDMRRRFTIYSRCLDIHNSFFDIHNNYFVIVGSGDSCRGHQLATCHGSENESLFGGGGLGHMAKMAAMPIYGKNPLNIFFSGTKGPMTLGLGFQHWELGPNQSLFK